MQSSNFVREFIEILGLTGFDSKMNRIVSMSGYVDVACQKMLQSIIGENNFALAA